MKQNVPKRIYYRNIKCDKQDKQTGKEEENIYRFNAFFEEMNNDRINNTTNVNRLIKPDTLSKSIQQSIRKFHLKAKPKSYLNSYNTKTMSILNKPTYFHYYLYDKKQDLSMFSNPYLSKKPKHLCENRDIKSTLSIPIKQSSRGGHKNDNLIQMINNDLRQSKIVFTVTSKMRNCSSFINKKNNNEFHSNVKTRCYIKPNNVNQLKTKETTPKIIDEDNNTMNNDLILQSVTINPVDSYKSNSKSKRRRNYSYSDYAFGEIEEQRIRKQLENISVNKLLTNEMIKDKTNPRDYYFNNSCKEFYSANYCLRLNSNINKKEP